MSTYNRGMGAIDIISDNYLSVDISAMSSLKGVLELRWKELFKGT